MNVAVFGSSATRPEDPEYGAGIELGRLLAADGHTVYTGGYAGLMEAVSQGAFQTGGRVVGIVSSAVFPERTGPNGYLTDSIDCATISERIHLLVSSTDAAIALPGSIGTLTELLVAWNRAFVARFSGVSPHPVITVGGAWRHLVGELGAALGTDASIVTCVDEVTAAVEILRTRWTEG